MSSFNNVARLKTSVPTIIFYLADIISGMQNITFTSCVVQYMPSAVISSLFRFDFANCLDTIYWCYSTISLYYLCLIFGYQAKLYPWIIDHDYFLARVLQRKILVPFIKLCWRLICLTDMMLRKLTSFQNSFPLSG